MFYIFIFIHFLVVFLSFCFFYICIDFFTIVFISFNYFFKIILGSLLFQLMFILFKGHFFMVLVIP